MSKPELKSLDDVTNRGHGKTRIDVKKKKPQVSRLAGTLEPRGPLKQDAAILRRGIRSTNSLAAGLLTAETGTISTLESFTVS